VPAQSSIRILLAEDNATNREVVLAMLDALGLTADTVLNGAQAVQALQRSDYSIVLMDCEMPEVDGYEATSQIRNPATGTLNPRVPIVALTANAMPGDREKCLQSGMDDYLPKPLDPEALAQVLAKWARWSMPTKNKFAGKTTAADIVFDRAGLLKRLGGNKRLAEKLVRGFLADIPSQLLSLRKHLDDGDATAARRQAHTLKGAAANLSAGSLRAAASDAEQAAMSGELNRLAELLPALEGEFERVKTTLANSDWT
jgi:CheY-like chemotaxis protein/HPt (histidine-containing phosphotransfer) domain-containing protein